MNLIKYIPNTFTILNLLSGCMGLISLYEGNISQGAVFILIGAVFDFLDGFS
ncbi:MAG: CDP-alcohol phosphatidyltransferase family protein, partial [Cyclobacteriaceae bacterium]